MNIEIIGVNIREALTELEDIKRQIDSGKIDEAEFQLELRHVYHHLNVAWNARNESTDSYREMTEVQFEQWGMFPPAL